MNLLILDASPPDPIVPPIPVTRVTIHVWMPLDPLVDNPLVPCDYGTPKVHHSLVHLAPWVNLKWILLIMFRQVFISPCSRRVLFPWQEVRRVQGEGRLCSPLHPQVWRTGTPWRSSTSPRQVSLQVDSFRNLHKQNLHFHLSQRAVQYNPLVIIKFFLRVFEPPRYIISEQWFPILRLFVYVDVLLSYCQ